MEETEIQTQGILNEADTGSKEIGSNTLHSTVTGDSTLDDNELDDTELDDEESTGLYEHYRFVADRGQKLMRVDQFIQEHLSNTSRNRIQRAADAGFILCNDHAVKRSYKVKPFDIIRVMLDRPHYDNAIVPEEIPINIVYEDDDLIVVNKQAGLVVHPGHGNWHGTLLNALAWHLKDFPEYDINNPEIGLVHRIDKDTSGLLVIAKTAEAKTKLGRQFFNKTTKREYNALVWGHIAEDEGRIEGNIGRNPKDRMQMTVFPPDSDMGKHAVTHYYPLQRFGYTTLVKCILETGRTHQIRAHMKHIGHVLFNDERYGGDQILKGTTSASYRQFIHNCFQVCPRQALHAKTLGFVHPRTGKEMMFTSELPDDMQALINKWNSYKI